MQRQSTSINGSSYNQQLTNKVDPAVNSSGQVGVHLVVQTACHVAVDPPYS